MQDRLGGPASFRNMAEVADEIHMFLKPFMSKYAHARYLERINIIRPGEYTC